MARSRKRGRPSVALLALVLLAAACGGGGSAPSADPARLVPELAEVPGYYYAELGPSELALQRSSLPEGVTSATFRTVHRVGSRLEIAFLVLFAADDPAPLLAEFDGWHRTTIAGQAVAWGEAPDTPQSRYRYVWARPGVLGYTDGPDEDELRRWLQGYFSGFNA